MKKTYQAPQITSYQFLLEGFLANSGDKSLGLFDDERADNGFTELSQKVESIWDDDEF